MSEAPGHPLQGRAVLAWTYPNVDEDGVPEEVRGSLDAHWLPGFERFQCFVDDVLVNPATVEEEQAEAGAGGEPVQKAGSFDESKVKRDHGQFATKPGDKGGGHDRKPGPEYDRKPSGVKAPRPMTPHEAEIPAPSERELEQLDHLTPKADRGSREKIAHAFDWVRTVVGGKLLELGLAATYDIAPAVLDVSEDYATGRAALYGDQDAFKQSTGVSWSFTMVLVKQAISAGFAAANYVKGGDAKKADGSEPDLAAAVAEVVAAALSALHEALGIDVDVDADLIRDLVAKRLGGE